MTTTTPQQGDFYIKLIAIIAISAFVGLYAAHAYEAEQERKEKLEISRGGGGRVPTTNPPQTQAAEDKLVEMLGPHQADYVKNQSTGFISCTNDPVAKEIVCYERK